MLAADFGDAPAPYPTLIAEGGAEHVATGLTLGAQRDMEADGVHSVAADGDDLAGSPNDEDGVTFGTIRVGALDASVTVNVQGAAGKLDAWIDFNGDGNWGGPGEQVFASIDVSTGDNQLSFDVPSDARQGETFARFRLSTAGGLAPAGSAPDGEIEDYAVTVMPSSASGSVSPIPNGISTSADSPVSVKSADVDGDGDLDVLSASQIDGKIAWYENDGNQSFTSHTIASDALLAADVVAADLDGDGDVDVLSASSGDDTIAWYENDGNENFMPHTISSAADGAYSVQVADVDGDGDLDVLSASTDDDTVAWYENDGSEGFTRRVIATDADSAQSVDVADIDGDGDLDVVSASQVDDKIAWYENDGSQNFTSHTISVVADGAASVDVADLDGDGDIDVLSASSFDDTIAWYENDGNQSFTRRTISVNANGAASIQAADVNGDGDIDVISASALSGTIEWHENDGNENFTTRVISLSASGASSVQAADVDGDGDLDVIGAARFIDNIVWYESEDLNLDFGDAPSPYPTLLADNGATHVSTGPRLGALRDSEADGQADDGDDEDGVMFGTTNVGNPTAGINIDLQGASNAKVDAWIDFGGDGVWDASDQILDSVDVIASLQTLNFMIPETAVVGSTYARVRVSTDGGLGPTGAAADGEVEDYLVVITQGVEVDLPSAENNNVTLRLNGMDVDVVETDNPTNVLASVPLASSQTLTINGGDMDDQVTVDYSAGFFQFPGGIFFSDPSGTDKLTIHDDGTAMATYQSGSTLGDGSVTIREGTLQSTISFTGVEPVDVTGMLTFDVDGGLDVGPHTLTIQSANAAELGPLTTLSGGSIVSTAGVVIEAGDRVVGTGTIETPGELVQLSMINGNVEGTSAIDPIHLPSFFNGTGRLNNVNIAGTYSPGMGAAQVVHGNVAFEDSADLVLELGGTTPGTFGHDQLFHTGTVQLDGSLSVELINGFTPSVGDSLQLIASTQGITGSFDTINLPPTPLGTAWDLSVDPFEVRLTMVDLVNVVSTTFGDGTSQRSHIQQLEVTFEGDVDIDEGAFSITQRESGAAVDNSFVTSVDGSGNTVATIRFDAASALTRGMANVLVDGNYEFSIDSTRVRRAGTSTLLDGNGDGLQGGQFLRGNQESDAFFARFGDSDGDRDVDGQDYGRFGLTFMKAAGEDGFNSVFDSDGDDDVDQQDYGNFGLVFLTIFDF